MKEEKIHENVLPTTVDPTVVLKSFQMDMVDGIYKIHTNETVNEINNEFCKYFNATGLEDGLEYFAIVFNRQFNPSLNTMQALKSNPLAHLNNIITYSIVKLSYSKSSSLFGIEIIVYSLNKNAPCLSPIFVNNYIINLSDLLITLDKYAAQFPDKFNIDRHIIAFIATKVDIEQESQVKILSNFPKFSDHSLIQGLCILNIAQQNESEIKIPNLSNVLTGKIIELFA